MDLTNDYSYYPIRQLIDVIRVIREEYLCDELCIHYRLAKERIKICNKARSIHAQFLSGEITGSMV